ncbi:MAG: phosphodiester glycosidase family protein [Bacilli bacterium]|nr:phosphodiester glycosidase family protein [Bacilli bacterium]
MMKKAIIPIVFALAGTSFVTYSFLDTFIITKSYELEVSFDFEKDDAASYFSFSFAQMESTPDDNSSSSSSSSKPNSSSNSNSNSQSSNNSSSSNSSSSSGSSENVSGTEIEPYLIDGKYYEDLSKEQIASLFTKEVVFEPKKHYSDPDIYVDISTGRFEDYTDFYAADIRIRSLSYLKAGLAYDTPGENYNEKTSDICNRHKGIIAINGDTYGSQKNGYVVRNGVVIRKEKNLSRKKPEDLAIYADGTFEIFNERDYTLDEIAAKGAWQVYSFGPGLISEGKKIIQKGEEVGTAAQQNMNQRCAIGMISPLHYVFMVSDGRIRQSPGLSLYQVGKVMESLHCYCAYNLDGGGSATMYLDDGSGNANGLGALVNYCTQQLVGGNNKDTLPIAPPIGEREVSDIVYIGKQ